MKTVRILVLTLSLALLLGCCAAGGGTVDSSAPAEVPTESQPVTDAPEAPSPLRDIVLEGVDTPGLMPDVAGFEHSLWGDSVSDVASCKPSSSWTLIDSSAALGGFPCQAYYIFGEDGLTGGVLSAECRGGIRSGPVPQCTGLSHRTLRRPLQSL